MIVIRQVVHLVDIEHIAVVQRLVDDLRHDQRIMDVHTTQIDDRRVRSDIQIEIDVHSTFTQVST